MKKPLGYQVLPFPQIRQPVIDSLVQARRMNMIHALLEVDVTDARQRVKEHRKKAGEPLSFTAFLTFCLARAVDENKVIQAYRRGRKLIVYDDVDISVVIERKIGEAKIPILPHVIKAANRKTLTEIHREISDVQGDEKLLSRAAPWIGRYYYLPGFLRSFLWRRLLGEPAWRKRLTGTVGLSAVGMFGKGTGWGIPVPTYNLNITIGGVSEKPGVVNGQVCPREYMGITASFNHDVVDGAPAARFLQRYRELIEGGEGL